MKLFIIGGSNLGPYHFSRYRALVRHFPELVYVQLPGKVVFRPWSSDLGQLPCRILSLEEGEDIVGLLEHESPDIVLTVGYSRWPLFRAAYWAKRLRVPCCLHCESTMDDRPRLWWKEAAKKLLVKNSYDAAFAAGERSARYAEHLGMPKHRIWRGIYAVDNEHFWSSREKWQGPEGFPSKFFLTVARLSPEKNLGRLLKAFFSYCERGGKWGLVIAGAGPEEERLKAGVPEDMKRYVHWYGWASYNELPSLYHGASCFIIPSISEPWGLVVNEAMAAGLPVLVSRQCGCLPELCDSGVNGYDFDPYNAGQLSELMHKISSREANTAAMGKESRLIIDRYTVDRWATTLADMARALVTKK